MKYQIVSLEVLIMFCIFFAQLWIADSADILNSQIYPEGFCLYIFELEDLRVIDYRGKKVKVKWSRYRPGVAQRVGRSKALLFHDRGTRREWVVSSTPRPHFTLGKDPIPILQEARWAPRAVWMGGKSSPQGIFCSLWLYSMFYGSVHSWYNGNKKSRSDVLLSVVFCSVLVRSLCSLLDLHSLWFHLWRGCPTFPYTNRCPWPRDVGLCMSACTCPPPGPITRS